MKKRLLPILSLATILTMLSSCASYKAAPLASLSADVFTSSPTEEKKEVLIAAKTFNKADCKWFLDRDVIAQGFQPVQLYIQNNSNKSYSFALNRIDLSVAQPSEVAARVHTSTVSRVLWYGVPGVILLWPLIIPAIVDGIKSSDANTALDTDFMSKAATDQTILPYASLNKILFVPVDQYQQSFNVTLVDQSSRESEVFSVLAN